MKNTKLYIIFTIAILLFAPAVTDASEDNRNIRVVFLHPADKGDSFWDMTTDFMRAAAEDLKIDLEIHYAKRNHILIVDQAKSVLATTPKPDYLLIGNEKGSAALIIRLAQKANVKVFLFNNGFISAKDIDHFAAPREKYPAWIGQLIPDNYQAGYVIGKKIITEGLKRGLTAPDGKLHIAAFAGAFNTHASLERVRGLQAAVEEHNETTVLQQVIPGDWTQKTAELKSRLMFSRYHDIGAVWGANDVTAFGAMRSAELLGKKPGEDIVFGSCGWFPLAIEQVQQGRLATTVGGHFMDGAWSLIMLYDYHNGIDFHGAESHSNMFSIDRSNVDAILPLFFEKDWQKIDFRRFSKSLNPSLEEYDFSFHRVVEEFGQG